MGTHYDQLQLAERFEISRQHAAGISLRKIAEHLGRSTSTVSREIKRNSKKTKAWKGGYEPERSHHLAARRRHWDCRYKLARQPELRRTVHDLLAMGWSPQQISGRLAREKGAPQISHESIYRYIYHRSAQKDYWHRLLPRRKSRRGRFRRGGSPVDKIRYRVSLAGRPAGIETRRQPGHWEGDLMCFARYQTMLVLHERTSRLMLAYYLPTKASEPVFRLIQRVFAGLPGDLRRSITFDNGTEFARHYKLNDSLGVKTYFCDPHAPWQKGGVENAIGRLRRWLPRGLQIASIAKQEINRIVANYNNTPRRCLDYKSPAEVFEKSFNPLHFNRETISPHSRA